MNSSRRNHREYLLRGLRARIEREAYGMGLLRLWSWLLDVSELPC